MKKWNQFLRSNGKTSYYYRIILASCKIIESKKMSEIYKMESDTQFDYTISKKENTS